MLNIALFVVTSLLLALLPLILIFKKRLMRLKVADILVMFAYAWIMAIIFMKGP